MLYSLHVSEFKFAGKLSQILQNYQCSIVEHSEVKETWDAQGQKIKAILLVQMYQLQEYIGKSQLSRASSS